MALLRVSASIRTEVDSFSSPGAEIDADSDGVSGAACIGDSSTETEPRRAAQSRGSLGRIHMRPRVKLERGPVRGGRLGLWRSTAGWLIF